MGRETRVAAVRSVKYAERTKARGGGGGGEKEGGSVATSWILQPQVAEGAGWQRGDCGIEFKSAPNAKRERERERERARERERESKCGEVKRRGPSLALSLR
jgi:hypothetical protein